MKNKILYILPSEEIGGTEKMVAILAKGISKFRFQPVVLTLQKRGSFHKMLDADYIRNYFLDVKRRPLQAIGKLLFIILKEKPCIMHSFLFTGNMFAKCLRIFCWIPLVCSQRSTDDWKRAVHWKLEKFTNFLCSIIISNSKAGKRVLIEKTGVTPLRIKVIPNGIDLEQIREKLKLVKSFYHTEIIIGSIGNLRKAKGYDVLIEAAEIICKKRKDIRFEILGKGPLETHIRAKIHKLNLGEFVKLYGFTEDVYNYIINFDIVVIPSIWEGFPVVALEAMACGKPIIATNVGDLPEIVENGTTGIIVEPGKPKALAAAILTLISNKDMRQMMGNNALRRVEEFSSDTMVSQYGKIYDLLLLRQ
ncbi:MAG: glycosyltransferase [Candidatus Omnitrophica bacterium]|nr:glycosyltransferase [Candidatus Omnitrophota bacterium]MCM8788803.1 glycosyltransferase [Candidatus Omnitrophota bacterium]